MKANMDEMQRLERKRRVKNKQGREDQSRNREKESRGSEIERKKERKKERGLRAKQTSNGRAYSLAGSIS